MAQPYDNINTTSVTIVPPSEIINRAYNASKQPEYIGHAVKGTANSSSYWTVRKYTYNADKQIVSERIAHNIAWDDRETATYS